MMKTKVKVTDVLDALKNNRFVRRILQKGQQFNFQIYGIDSTVIIKNNEYYSGINLINIPVTELTWEEISKFTLILSGGEGIPDHNLFVSENNDLHVFSNNSLDFFYDSQWFEIFKKLLALRSCMMDIIISHEKTKTQYETKVGKDWIFI